MYRQAKRSRGRGLKKYALSTALGVTLTACQTFQPKACIIAYFGDSTIYGQNPDGKTQIQNNAPRVLELELSKRCGHTVTVLNWGKNKATAAELLYGSQRYPGGFTKILQSTKAQYAIVNYGINDATRGTPTEYRMQLEAFYKISLAAGVTLIYETPNPVVISNPRIKPALSEGVASRVAMMEMVAVANSTPLVNQFRYLSTMSNLAELIPDGIHPTEFTLAIKARRVADRIAPIICR